MYAPTGGFRNDVWYSEMSSKSVASWIKSSQGSAHDQTRNHKSVVRATMTWHQSNPGYIAPLTWPSGPQKGKVLTYDDWLICQDYFNGTRSTTLSCDDPEPICYENLTFPGCHVESTFKRNNMWSPRRGHATVVANDVIYVIGGRAREHVPDHDTRLVGGSMHQIAINEDSTFREKAILKNDIWMSPDDGKTWKLISPGCKDQQEDILMKTEFWLGNKSSITGSSGAECTTSDDCYGGAICKIIHESQKAVCVCPMFGVREHHSVVVQHRHIKRDDNTTFSQDYMYLIGGFTTVRQNFCSDHSCGSQTSYKIALDDVWVSSDGYSWLQLKPALGRKGFRPRGSHTSLLLHDNPFTQSTSKDRLFIFGGETNNIQEEQSEYLNDVWVTNLTSIPCCHKHGRCEQRHALSEEDIGICLPSTSDWKQISANATWSGRSGHVSIHEPPSAINQFTDKIYLMGGRTNNQVHSDVWVWDINYTGEWEDDYNVDYDGIVDSNMSKNHLNHYYDQASNLSDIKRSFLPLPNKLRDDESSFYSFQNILKQEEINYLHSLGIITFSDLSNANLRTILKARGFNFPGVETSNVSSICYLKSLVTAVIRKCEVVERPIYDIEEENDTCQPDEEKCIVQNWDGCSPLPNFSKIDVHGLGLVSVPMAEEDPSSDLEEMHCKQTPGPRFLAAGTFVDGRVLLMGGKGSNLKSLYQDVWSRDDTAPRSSMKVKPTTNSIQSKFVFDSDEDGAIQFEYKLVDSVERLDVTSWILANTNDVVDVSWLDTKKGGPGSGWYTLYLRAIDTSGNRDIGFILGRNVYTWYYLQPLPWNMISAGIVLIVVLVSATYIEYRRRVRKAAFERFAQRQMRRKFKLHAMSEAGKGNWKDYYHNQAIQRRPHQQTKDKRNDREDSIDPSSPSSYRQRRQRRNEIERRDEQLWKKRRRERRKQRRGDIYRQHDNHSQNSSSEEEEHRDEGSVIDRSGRKKHLKQKHR